MHMIMERFVQQKVEIELEIKNFLFFLNNSNTKGKICKKCNKSNHFANVCRAKIERHYTDSNPQSNSQVQRPIYPYDNRPMNHQDDEFEKDQDILKGALLGAVGGLAALGVGGLIAYGIRESKVCFIFFSNAYNSGT